MAAQNKTRKSNTAASFSPFPLIIYTHILHTHIIFMLAGEEEKKFSNQENKRMSTAHDELKNEIAKFQQQNTN